MTERIQLAVNGAAGRMGRRIVALAAADEELQIVAALEHSESSLQGADAGELAGVGKLGIPVTAELVDRPDVIIDFRCRPVCLPSPAPVRNVASRWWPPQPA